MHTPPSSHKRVSRSTIGESLITIAALLGFLALAWQGTLTFQSIWTYSLLLVVIVLFYFGLLFARMLFFWMTGGDSTPWWLEMYNKEVARKEKK